MNTLQISENLRIEFNDDGFFFIKRRNEDEPEHHARPDSFGSLIFTMVKHYDVIDSFLSHVRPLSYFKEAFALLDSKVDYSYCIEYIQEEIGNIKNINETHVRLLAECYTASFPALTSIEAIRDGKRIESSFLYDGFYGLIWNSLPDHMTLASKNLHDFTYNLFGVYRKDLAKLALKTDLDTLGIVSKFRNCIDANHIKNKLELYKEINVRDFIELHSLDVLSVLSDTTRLRLFENVFVKSEEALYVINDTIDMLSVIQDSASQLPKIKSWVQLHDEVMILAPDVSSELTVVPPEDLKRLQKSNLNEIEFNILTESKDFVSFGAKLALCLGRANYLQKSLRSESFCFVLKKADEPYGALEVACDSRTRQWGVVQLKGYENKDLHEGPELRDFVLTTLNAGKKKSQLVHL